MASKKSYSRFFIILQEDEKGHGLTSDKGPSGYTKIEVKNNKCKLSYYVQNLRKSDREYYMALICDKGEIKKILNISKLNIDDHGKVDTTCEYDIDNIANTGIGVDKISGSAIISLNGDRFKSIMNGFITNKISEDWRNFDIVSEDMLKRQEKEQENIETKFDEYEKQIESKKAPKQDEELEIEGTKNKVLENEENIGNAIKVEDEELSRKKKKEKKMKKKDEDCEYDCDCECDYEKDEDDKKKKDYKEYKEKKMKKKEKDEDYDYEYDYEKDEDDKKKKDYKEYKEKKMKKKEKDEDYDYEYDYEKDEDYKKKKDYEEYKEKKMKKKEKDEDYDYEYDYEKNEDYKKKKNYKEYKEKKKEKGNDCEYDYYEMHKEHMKKKEDDMEYKINLKEPQVNYNQGIMNKFFKDILKDFEKVTGYDEIKNSTWYKVNIYQLEDMYCMNDYKKYTVIYYPLICYYPYIAKYKHCMIGHKHDKNGDLKYLMYAIPGKKCECEQPYGGKTGFVTWMPSKDSEDYGYWVMFYDFKNSTVVVPVKR
ncbi:MAG: hypothetical protein ACRCW0_04160 [Clostridium sp.]